MKLSLTRALLDPKEIAAALAKKKDEAKTAAETSSKLKKDAESAKAHLEAIKAAKEPPSPPEAIAEAENNYAQARAASTIAGDASAALNATVAGLEQMLKEALLAGGTWAYSYTAKLELLPAEPDTRLRLIA